MRMEINYQEELKNFLDSQGRLKAYPSKHKNKILALFYLSTKFKKGLIYSEREVNAIIDSFHTFGDRCLLRRELYDKKFLGRSNDCTRYWLEDKQPTLEELLK